jgi:hypothetical protein
VDGGENVVRWAVRDRSVWRGVSRAEGAEIEKVDSAPRVVWERRVHLMLDVGAEALREERTPRAAPRLDALAYLQRETRAAPQAVHRKLYRVAADGRLVLSTGSRRPPPAK